MPNTFHILVNDKTSLSKFKRMEVEYYKSIKFYGEEFCIHHRWSITLNDIDPNCFVISHKDLGFRFPLETTTLTKMVNKSRNFIYKTKGKEKLLNAVRHGHKIKQEAIVNKIKGKKNV